MFKATVSVLLGYALLTPLLVGFVLYSRGIQARPPGKWETQAMTWTKHRFLVGDKSAMDPLLANAENIAEGQQNFSHYCYACHGLDGQGTGVPFGDAMSPPVPSLASSNVQTYTDGQLHWVIKNGLWLTGMPAAKGTLSEEEMWSIVLYIRHLPAAGSLGEPRAYSGNVTAVR